MPQIEQVQSVWWGPLRPDPVDLAVDGINVATGPNGSGKTTLLDAVKLILGVQDLARRPAQYIFDGGGDPSLRADRALIKVVFANPERPGRAGRLFADAGRGCEVTPYVTAVCEVTRERRRYAILPGYLPWGGPGRSLQEDLGRLSEKIPASHWLRPREWSELLARAGVTKALLGVISVRQGEADKAIEGSPEALLRKVLELTGKQQTLEEFRRARTRLAEVRAEYDDTLRRYEVERRQLDALEVQANRHLEFRETDARLGRVERVLLPAARYAHASAELGRLRKEREGQVDRLAKDRAELERLDAEIPMLEDRHRDVLIEVERLGADLRAAAGGLQGAAAEAAVAGERLDQARAAIAVSGPVDVEEVAEADRAAAEADRSAHEAEVERDRLRMELDELRAGRPIRPEGLDRFREELAGRGIGSELVAEQVEVPHGVAAEAALGEGVWTLVVAQGRFEEAVALSQELGHRLPLAAAGPGEPVGALAGAAGLDDALGFLEEVDLPLAPSGGETSVASPTVSTEGLVRGRRWAVYRAPERPLLGAGAREQAIFLAEGALAEVESAIPSLREDAQRVAERARDMRRGLDARLQLPQLESRAAETDRAREEANARHEAVSAALAVLGPDQGRVEEELTGKRSRRDDLSRRITTETEPRLLAYDRQVEVAEAALAATPSVEEQVAPEDLPSVEVLEHERAELARRLDDDVTFPPDVRTELVLAHRDDQARTVEEVSRLVEGRRHDLEGVSTEVERAKERYDRHIREVVHLLAARFREVCSQAGMDGDIVVVPSEVEGEFAIDVKVAHALGEPKRSYQSPAHSGGQRAKISILLLLATMGLEGSADLLIMDEHIAHLDSANIEYVADVMTALKHRVQFILATPTNAEAGRLGWCDHQLAFYPRVPGEAYAPPIRLFTRLPENGERYAAMGQLSLAE